MLYFLKDKFECTGCTACMASCPTKCITMQQDEKGFHYPVADKSKCVDCGICEKVCHVRNKISCKSAFGQFAVAARSKDLDVWKQSTSGGAFSEICRAVSEVATTEMYVFGAMFDGLKVVHEGKKWPDISALRKSKYVQSDMKECFVRIKELLHEDKNVVFSGTPCQVAGLRNFLGERPEKLLCVEFICHGVGSPLVFKKYIDELETYTGKMVDKYEFRTRKKIHGRSARYLSKITYKDGMTEYVEIDKYNELFLNQLCLRDCCGEHCRYRKIERTADITIADFNNFEGLFPKVRDEKTYSAIVINTEKGKRIYDKLAENMIIYSSSIADIIKYNPLFAASTSENTQRTEFFEDFCAGMSIERLCNKYCKQHKKSIVSVLKGYVPYDIIYLYRRVKRYFLRRFNGGND